MAYKYQHGQDTKRTHRRMFRSGIITAQSTISRNVFAQRSFTSSSIVLAKAKSRQKAKVKEQLRMKNLEKDYSFNPLYMPIPNAMRYLRAAEVGNSAMVVLYLHVAQQAGAKPLAGNINFPHGMSKFKPIVFTSDPEKIEELKKNNITHTGGKELVEKIANKEIDPDQFTHAFATPEVDLKPIARIMGPRGLMPSAKKNTVTEDINVILGLASLTPFKQRGLNISFPVGTTSMSDAQIVENIKAASDAVYAQIDPEASKKTVLSKCFISSFQGPGLIIPFKQPQ